MGEIPTGRDQPPDLLICDREPIHIPGLIQPNGMLLAVGDDGVVSHASENLDVPLCPTARAALGRPLAEALGPAIARLALAVNEVASVHLQEPVFVGAWPGWARRPPVMISAHRYDARTIIDIEPAAPEEKGSTPPLNWCYHLQRGMLQFADSDQVAKCLAAAVHEVTHCDNVMVYEFDRDWHGHVVAEARRSGQSASYLSQHFPATDIPAQARRLYLRQMLRIVVDSHEPGVPVLGPPGERPLDMSFSALRSVSPLHLEYLRNMGVRASLVASILVGDQLWGLLVGHHYGEPWMPSLHDRKAFSMGAILAGGVLAMLPLAETLELTTAIDQSIARIAARLATAGRVQAVVQEFPMLAQTLGLHGITVQIEGDSAAAGATIPLLPASNSPPPELMVDRFPETLFAHEPGPGDVVGGCVFRIGNEPSDIVILGRTEHARVVHWGGNPDKSLLATGGNPERLHPRGSFELWKETVRGRSRDFSRAETAAIQVFQQKLTGLIQAENERLRRERANQTERLTAIGRLAGGVAHDLNNLLGVVSLNLDGVLETLSAEEADASVQAALQAVQAGSQITAALLSFARKQPMRRADIKAGTFLPEFCAMAKALLGTGFGLDLICGTGVWLCQADPAQLQTALLNLTLNARDSMLPAGGVVTIAARNLSSPTPVAGLGHDIPAGDYIAFSVSDQGRGMSADVLRHATEPFFTTKATGKGTGLGLPAVLGFAAQSGGTLTIESSPGHGTVATILLPRVGHAPMRSPALRAVNTAPVLTGLRLLVVEDRLDLAGVVTASCRRIGLQVTVSRTAEQAIGLLTPAAFDLVLSDVLLSGQGSGLDVLAQAQALEPPIPVLLMTGFAELTEAQAAALSRHRLLRKPFRAKELIDALVDLVGSG